VTRADLKEGAEGVGPLAGNEAHARVESESGVPVFFDSIAGAGSKDAGFGLQLTGTKGIVDIRGDQSPPTHLLAGNPFAPTTEPRAWVPITSAGPGEAEPIVDVALLVSSHGASGRDLLAAIRENRAPLCDVRAGAAVIEAISGVFESHRLNGQRVAFPLATRVNPLSLL